MSFGEQVTVGASIIYGLFMADSAGGGTREGPELRIKTSDRVSLNILQGTLINVRGVEHVVEGLQPDGHGTTTLVLSQT